MLTSKNISNFFHFVFDFLSCGSFKRTHGPQPRPKPKANKKKKWQDLSHKKTWEFGGKMSFGCKPHGHAQIIL
jgi:hypothetical protein